MTPAPYTEDTIVAVATAPGRGGIGIVRLSGPLAETIACTLCGRALQARHAHLVTLRDAAGEPIDSAIAILYPQPLSFTGETVAELQCHGGPVVLDMLVQACCSLGARPALPGEFSQRAYLNDKIDLTQAEAIADLINSTTAQAARNAVRSLDGEFSRRIDALVSDITRIRVFVEAAIDFPEEEVDFIADADLAPQLTSVAQALQAVKRAAAEGSRIREGLKLVIAGRPNAGKSSLLNALSGRDSAIVTPVPGTTRDVLREHIAIDGLPIHVIDTAGLRSSADLIEQEGIRRALREIADADLILLVVDDNAPTPEPSLADLLPPESAGFDLQAPVVVVRNKCDLSGRTPTLQCTGGTTEITLSAQTGAGMEILKTQIRTCAGLSSATESQFSARRRHLDALARAEQFLASASAQLHAARGELLAEDLRACQDVLGEITGRVSSDALLGEIFSSFCIGK